MASSQQLQELGLDHRGERRLSPKESALWYTVAAVTYIAIGTWQKVLLTWFIGPMWVVATLTFGPRIYDRVRGRSNDAKPVGQPDTLIPTSPAHPGHPADSEDSARSTHSTLSTHSTHSAKDTTP